MIQAINYATYVHWHIPHSLRALRSTTEQMPALVFIASRDFQRGFEGLPKIQHLEQGCQIFLLQLTKTDKIYHITLICTEKP
jgi:hypothetical protein